MTPVIKLSAGGGRGFWEIPVVYEDDHVLVIDKPSGLLVSPDRYDKDRPNLMRMLLDGVAQAKPMVPPLPAVAGSPLIGWLTEKMPVGVM